MKWKLFWRNFKTLTKALASEKSIIAKPKLTKKKKTTRRKVKTAEIIWPVGEVTWKDLCQKRKISV